MKKICTLFFLICSSVSFSQKIKLKVLDVDTNTAIERAHVFFANKTTYTNEKGEFSI